MRAAVDIIVVLNIVAGLIGFLWRRHRKQKLESNLDHIKRLEVEHKEIDAALERMRSEGSDVTCHKEEK